MDAASRKYRSIAWEYRFFFSRCGLSVSRAQYVFFKWITLFDGIGMVTWGGGGGGWRCLFSRVTQVEMVASGLIGAFQRESWLMAKISLFCANLFLGTRGYRSGKCYRTVMLLFSNLISPREKRNESTCAHHTQATVGGKNARCQDLCVVRVSNYW